MTYKSSLEKTTSSKVHSDQYKASNMKNASKGRVMTDGKKSLMKTSVSRPSGRTSYVAGTKDASTDAK